MPTRIHRSGSQTTRPTGDYYPSGDSTGFQCVPGGENFYGASLTPSIAFSRCIPGFRDANGNPMTVWDIVKQRQLQALEAIGEKVAVFSRLLEPAIIRTNLLITAWDNVSPNFVKVFWTLSDRVHTHQVPNIDAADFAVFIDGVQAVNVTSITNLQYDDEYAPVIEYDGSYVLVMNRNFNAAAHVITISYSTVCECVLVNRGQLQDPSCPFCNGTTFYQGYVMYVNPLRPDGLVPMSIATNQRTRPIQDPGLNKLFQTTAAAPSFPLMRERDFIVRFWPNGDTRERLQVTGVTYIEGKDAILLEQQLALERVREGHEITKIRASDVAHVTIIPGSEDQESLPGDVGDDPLDPTLPGSMYYIPLVTGLQLQLVN